VRGQTEATPVLLGGEVDRPDALPRRSGRVAEIVDAARRVLESEGTDALTMRRLADELGMQAPSLYKHFPSKGDLEVALIEDAMVEIGEVSHRALREPGPDGGLVHLLFTYRRYCTEHANLYRLATRGPLPREKMTAGLEDWAGNPWFVVTGDPQLAQALWSFAHGMTILEIDGRYPPGSDLEGTWRAGATAFEQRVRRTG
jgi:AcrR family transcriptional regulator